MHQLSSRFWIAIAFACELSAQTPARVDLERQLWTGIKQALAGADGYEYFQSSMKDALLPKLKGTLISVVPIGAQNALVLGLTDSTPEVALRVDYFSRELTPGATIEFEGVPTGFTKDPFLVTFDVEVAGVTKPLGAIASSWYFGPALGHVKSGRYRNGSTRLQFDLPSDWTVEATRPSADTGDVVILRHSDFPGAIAGVWMVRHKIRAPEVSKLIDTIPEAVVSAGLENYKVRPESLQYTWISGRQALTALADYEENGAKMSESITWIVTEQTRVLFFARATAYDLPLFQTRYEQIINGAVIP